VEEAAAEQRAILSSFETRRRDQSAQQFMVVERRAAAARLADEQAVAHTVGHRCNIEAAWATMAAAEQRLAQVDRAGDGGGGAPMTRAVVPSSFLRFGGPAIGGTPDIHLLPRGRRASPSLGVAEESHRGRGMVPRWSDDGAGPANAPPPPSGASGADAAGDDSDEDVLF
jgi:hypothetical protein